MFDFVRFCPENLPAEEGRRKVSRFRKIPCAPNIIVPRPAAAGSAVQVELRFSIW